MISIRSAGKDTIGYDTLGALLHWATFVGFISLDFVAKAIHRLLFPLLIAMLLAGLGSVLAASGGLSLPGIPRLLGQTEQLAKSLASAQHMILVAILAVVSLHAAAALWRRHFRHDATLGRIVSWLRGRA
jgi:cytochrome b561